MNERLKAALEYADLGWGVFPLDGKRPYSGTHGHRDATTDKKQIRRWWKEYPEANVGVACSSEGAGPIVVDIDGLDGKEMLRTLENRFGRLPKTLMATSGRKHRRHLYFTPDGEPIKRTIKIGGASLDILGDGGYVVAPPSLHPKTGEPYRWLNDEEPAELPETIRRAISGERKRASAPPLPEVIPEGQRDTLLTSLAGSMRRRGASEDSILDALRSENQLKCDPPLEEHQLEKIARSSQTWEPVPIELGEELSDLSLGERFAVLEKDNLRFCPQWKRWLIWDGARWARDDTTEAQRRMQKMIRGLLELTETVGDHDDREKLAKQVRRYTQRRKLDDALVMASTQVRLVVTVEKLDADPWLLNLKNGTLDLRTGKLKPHDPDDLITKLAPVEFDRSAHCPRWNGFVSYIMEEDPELDRFLQRAIGYTLVGVSSEHAIFFGHGSGANGKTTFLETIKDLMGDYATSIDFETLLVSKYGGGSNKERDLPRLHKARFVLADEAPTNSRWDERMVKKLTGGNTLSGRWLYREKFDFEPTHTLWCQANDKPGSYDPSHAFWRRMKLIPFKVKIPEDQQVRDYKDQLIEELPGILNWALKGCRDWQRSVKRQLSNTLAEPKAVKQETQRYRQTTDAVGEFLKTQCRVAGKGFTPTTELYHAFESWWKSTRGQQMGMNRHQFINALEKRPKLVAGKRDGQHGWLGIIVNREIRTL